MTQWQINDNLIWTRGKHTFKFGVNTRRVDVSDYDLGEGTRADGRLQRSGAVHLWRGLHGEPDFPVSLKERVAAGNLDLYAMDTYKPTPRATLTAGMRATWNTESGE